MQIKVGYQCTCIAQFFMIKIQYITLSFLYLCKKLIFLQISYLNSNHSSLNSCIMSHVEMGYEQVESRLSIIGSFTPLPVPKRYCEPTFIETTLFHNLPEIRWFMMTYFRVKFKPYPNPFCYLTHTAQTGSWREIFRGDALLRNFLHANKSWYTVFLFPKECVIIPNSHFSQKLKKIQLDN